MKASYYNEFDKYPAQWLRNLIDAGHLKAGVVDERSIVDVTSDDLRPYDRCHFFAGISGWGRALRLAGVPDDFPVWTGSCPCQPFSAAGKQLAHADPRDLWPHLLRLIAERRPAVVFGEQVASRLGREWLAGVRADLEGLGYAVGAADLCAAGVGAPHIRQRLFWGATTRRLADADGQGRSLLEEFDRRALARGEVQQWFDTDGRGDPDGLADSPDARQLWREDAGAGRCDTGTVPGGGQGCAGFCEFERGRPAVRLADADGGIAGDGGLQPGGQHGLEPQDDGARGLGDADGWEPQQLARHGARSGDQEGRRPRSELAGPGPFGGLADDRGEGRGALQWASPEDRRAQVEPDRHRYAFWSRYDVVHCTDGKARRFEPGSFPLAHGALSRVGRLRAYGNTIVPQAAAVFIRAFLSGIAADY